MRKRPDEVAVRSEFLPFKYEGVPTVSELLRSREQFGWKCRKYSKWRDVHGDREDPKRLHRMASSLLDAGNVSRRDFGALCAVMEKVQRWRCDRETLAIEPPRRVAWERLNARMKIARKEPNILASVVRDLGGCDLSDPIRVAIIFVTAELFGFMEGAEIDHSINVSVKELSQLSDIGLRRVAGQIGAAVYKEAALEWRPSNETTLQILSAILHQLDIESIAETDVAGFQFQREFESTAEGVVLEYVDMDVAILLKVASVRGLTVVKINNRHPLVETLGERDGKSVAEALFSAIGTTVTDLVAEKKCAEDFLAYLGLNAHRVN